MRTCIAIVSLVVSVLQVCADTIHGYVTNQNGIPVISHVKVFNRNDEMSDSLRTDILGNFHAEVCSPDGGRLHIYARGYSPLDVALSEIRKDSVNTFVLEKDSSVILNEVRVYAPREIPTLEKTVIYPEKQILDNNHSFLGVLQDLMLPGLETNSVLQTASIYGKKVIFKINGIPKPIESVLSLSPSSIKMIEYSSSLSIKESTGGAGGMINIILKDKDYGMSIYNSLYSAVSTGMVNETLGLSFNKGNHLISLDYNLQWRSYTNSITDSYSEYLSGPYLLARSSSGKSGVLRMCLNNIYASYAYSHNGRTKLSFSCGYLFGPWKRKTLTESSDLYSTGEMPDRYLNRKLISLPYSVPATGLYFLHRFGNGSKLEYNLTTGFNNSNNTWSQEYSFDDRASQYFENTICSDKWSLVNEISWDKRMGKNTLKLGINESYTNTVNKYMSASQVYSARLRENELFPYIEFTGKAGALNYSIGTGLYYVNRKIPDGISRNLLNNYSTIRLFLNLHHGFNINGAFRFSPDYPALGGLADYFLVTDNITATKGNPDIRRSSCLMSETNFSYSKGSFSSYLRFTYDKIWNPFFQVTSFLSPYYVSMTVNGRDESRYSVGLNLQYRKSLSNNISYGLKIFAELCGFRSVLSNTTKHGLLSYYISGNCFINYRDWTLTVSGNSKYKSLSGEVITTVCPYSNISLDYRWKSFNFAFVAAWLGNKDGDYKKFQSLSEVNPYITKNLIRDNANCLGIAVTYRFDYGKKPKYSIEKRNQSSIQQKSVQLIE